MEALPSCGCIGRDPQGLPRRGVRARDRADRRRARDPEVVSPRTARSCCHARRPSACASTVRSESAPTTPPSEDDGKNIQSGPAYVSGLAHPGDPASQAPSARRRYTVRWSVVSDDGHEEEGLLAFAVGRGGPTPVAVLVDAPRVRDLAADRHARPVLRGRARRRRRRRLHALRPSSARAGGVAAATPVASALRLLPRGVLRQRCARPHDRGGRHAVRPGRDRRGRRVGCGRRRRRLAPTRHRLRYAGLGRGRDPAPLPQPRRPRLRCKPAVDHCAGRRPDSLSALPRVWVGGLASLSLVLRSCLQRLAPWPRPGSRRSPSRPSSLWRSPALLER